MRPRWYSEWSGRQSMRFVGGYDRFDLWVYKIDRGGEAKDEIRVIWGEEARRWTWLDYDERRRKLVIVYFDLIDGPSNDEMELLIQYLRCFVPETAELVGD
jgi:hypothetical protein